MCVAPRARAAPPDDPAGDQGTEPAVAPRIETLWIVERGGIDAPVVVEAIRLRLPGRSIALGKQPEGIESLAAVEVSADEAQIILRVVLPDGRAYRRTTEVETGQTERIIASALAQLVSAIEEDVAVPDETDAPLPEPEPELPSEPEPEQPAEPDPEPIEPPALADTRPAEPEPEVPPLEIGVRVGGQAVYGAPEPPFRGLYGTLHVDVRLRSGLILSLGNRVGGFRTEPSLLRGDTSFEIGYAWRRGAFELVAAGGPWVGWWTVPFEDPVNIRNHGPGPVFGLVGRVAPSVRIQGRDGGPSFRLGVDVSVGVGGERFSRVAVLAGDPPPFAVGGVEGTVGVFVGGYFPIRSKKK